MAVITGISTEGKWIKPNAEIPFIGGVFAFIVIFVVPVICSFALQNVVPGLHDEIGFTKSMLVLLPTWNLFLWLMKVKTLFFYLPAWLLLGVIAILKSLEMFT